MLLWAKGAAFTSGFDIDPQYINENVSLNDSLMKIPNVGNFILTNPPYLAKNKMSLDMKKKYLKDGLDDLYQAALRKIIGSNYSEGIIILPVNFLCAENSDNIRKAFMSKYNICGVNYFTERVFADTTYNVIAMHFVLGEGDKKVLNIKVFPDNKILSFEVEKEFSYRIGGRELAEISKTKNVLNIKRLVENDMLINLGGKEIVGFYNDYKNVRKYNISDEFNKRLENNIIAIECIDGKKSRIAAIDMRDKEFNILIGKNTSRNIAYILMENIPISLQEKLITEFNKQLNIFRYKYESLFLTNFRDNNRKRISFDFCYKLINHCFINM